MQDSRFSDSVLGGRHYTLGRKLRPFSYWHLFQLESIDSPFLTQRGLEDPRIITQALHAAVAICRTVYPNRAKRRSRILRIWDLWRMGNCVDEAMSFHGYIRFYTQVPEFWVSDKATMTIGQMPQALSGVISQMMIGKTEEQAWNTPFGLGEWNKSARSALMGAELDFIQPMDEDGKEKIKGLKEWMHSMAEAIINGGDAIQWAEKLQENKLLTSKTYKLVEDWQNSSGSRRKLSQEALENALPEVREMAKKCQKKKA